eukprot:sb/3479434/
MSRKENTCIHQKRPPGTPATAQQPTSTRSSSRFKTPTVKEEPTVKLEETPITPSSEHGNHTTPATGFAQLGETPVTDPAVKGEQGPVSEAQRDFDTLGETPGPSTSGDVADDKSNLTGSKEKNDNGAGGRAKRRRTQTQFFGEVTPSDAVINQGTEKQEEDETKDVDSDFDPTGAGDDDGSKFKRPTQTVVRSSHIAAGAPRERTGKTFQHMLEITQFLASIPRNVDEIPFHPAFLKHR